ncbi:MAG: hypothetical protein M3Y71_14575 [Actinomycetota bacterium]|nr:hypothetical protein [Actinomycetota bacterium]
MSASFPAPTQIARAADAGLGNFVCPLRSARGGGLRKIVAGLATSALAAAAWTHLTWDSTLVDGLVITLALAGLVVAALGLVGLIGADGEVHLYEDGYMKVRGGREDVVLYATAHEGEWLRIKARTALYSQAA